MEYQHPQPVQPLGPPAPPPQLLPPAPPPPLPSLPQLQHGHVQDDDRWSQYHIWRQHVFVNGKSVNNKDPLEDKKDDSELWEAQAAFLGPNLWDKTLPYDPDLKVQEYVDLDEFLSENGMPGEGLGGAHLGSSAFGAGAGLGLGLQAPVTKRERSPSPSDCMSPDTINPPLSPADSTFSMASSGRDFDPRTRAFSDEELKPQPMIKKSRKQVNEFVPDDLKDDKYWARRRKNNMAAKRSRDARRMKENQIALRAGYLEKENMGLRQEVELLKKENHILREKLSKYADV
ncbi:hepatic leukemia factor isoform X4 [Danaus plexippus]|uniref:hepatic leukemia factor isoform X4 n=1 Tax=Danaus plexippus TaxID=13037 RepID=UPI002AB23D25|nr:hepatic leukemia factor isoform X4 [Danaus plexippus]